MGANNGLWAGIVPACYDIGKYGSSYYDMCWSTGTTDIVAPTSKDVIVNILNTPDIRLSQDNVLTPPQIDVQTVSLDKPTFIVKNKKSKYLVDSS